MQKLAKDIVDSAVSGKMKQSVLRHFRDFSYHSYVYDCYLRIPKFMAYDKPKLKDLNEILSKTLTVDMVSQLYVKGMACMNYFLPSIHYQLFNYKIEGIREELKKCFLYVQDTILLRYHIQEYMKKVDLYPLQANITISKYGKGYWEPFRQKILITDMIVNSKSERECYERAINKISLVNNPEYTRTNCRNMYKIHKIRFNKVWDSHIYPKQFYDMYIQCCNHWNIEPHLQLIKT